jgi:hypothetical protein
MDDILRILADLVEAEPVRAGDDGRERCVFCGVVVDAEEHDPGCLIERAQAAWMKATGRPWVPRS